jgi:UDP-N-acetylmuramoyl-tripeptide--D-alanyl-D-alanine ligase
MAELGSYSQASHKEVGAYAKAQGVEHLFAVGVASACACESFSGAKFFSEQAALAAYLTEFLLEGDVVLFKGSRSSNIDRLVTVFAKKESN